MNPSPKKRVCVWLALGAAADREALAASAGINAIFCNSGERLLQAASAGRTECIVIDPALVRDWGRTKGARALLGEVPVVLRTALSSVAAQALIELAEWIPIGHISLCGDDRLAADIKQLLDVPVSPAPALTLLPKVGSPLKREAIAAAVLGRRRSHLIDLARVCGLPTRTLQWRFERYAGGATTVSCVLGLSLALHTVWRMERLGWTLKRCAAEAGFHDAHCLSAYVQRHVGQRPRELMHGNGFDRLVGQWRESTRWTESR